MMVATEANRWITRRERPPCREVARLKDLGDRRVLCRHSREPNARAGAASESKEKQLSNAPAGPC